MQVHGSCHCRSITYEAEVDPARVTICHCTDCQELTGTAFRVSVPTLQKDFSLLTGSPATYVKTAESGAKRAQVFCPNCGSPLYTHAAVEHPQTYGLRVGCLVEREKLAPGRQIWFRSALRWSLNVADLPRHERE